MNGILEAPSRRLLLFGFTLELFLIGMLGLGNLRESIPLFLLLYFSAFLVYLGIVHYNRRLPNQHESDQGILLLIVGFAILFRATLFFSAPSLSDDIYRYLWDGKLVIEGINPYSHVPGSNELSNLRDSQYDMINHKDIGTPYGPLTIVFFTLSRYITESILFMKVPFILFDCLTIVLIVRMLGLCGVSKNNVIVYAWNPLVIIEIAGSGHSDSLGVFMLLVTIYSIQQGKRWSATAGFGLAILSKYFSLLFVPVIVKFIPVKNWGLIPVILLAGYLPFVEHLESHVLNILRVGSLWRFNDSLFSLLLLAAHSPLLAKALVIIAFVALAVIVWRSHWSPVKCAMILIGGTLLLTTTVQPWYLVWMVPFLCFSPNRAWILYTGLVMLSYHVLIRYDAEGIWAENLWIRLTIYVPFYLLLLGDAIRNLRATNA